MKGAIPLSLPLKGDRAYVHSTDLYPAALQVVSERWHLGDLRHVQLVCRIRTGHELALTRSQPGLEERVAVFSFQVGDEKHKLYFVRREGDIQRRVPYDEEAIAARGELDVEDKSVIYRPHEAVVATLIEAVVASAKTLHQALFPDAGQWVVTQIESECPLAEVPFSELRIAFERSMGGARLTRSEISLDGETLGHIFFSAT